MTDRELRQRLAELIMEALEVGSRKHERDVIDEIFDSFNLDFSGLDARFPLKLRNRTGLLRSRAASRLAEAAPTATDLLNEFVRRGGRFVAMLDEVYARLSRHTATTTGTSETFRLKRAGVDTEHLDINPAFIEKVRRLEQSLRALEIGVIDEAALSSLVGWDGGELYGRWPVGADDGRYLADAVLQLAWITPEVSRHASSDAAWNRIPPAVEVARAAAERLMTAAGRLVRAHVAHLDALSDTDAETAVGQLFSNKPHWGWNDALTELGHFRDMRILGNTTAWDKLAGADETIVTGVPDDRGIIIGLRDNLEPVAMPATGSWYGTGVSSLAGYIAMWRLGLSPEIWRSEHQDQLLADPAALMSWLELGHDLLRSSVGVACG